VAEPLILADTSAVVAFLRASGSAANVRMRELLVEDPPTLTEPVMLEVLAGARSRAELRRIRRFLNSLEIVPVVGLDDNERAADLYRRCRARGVTIRGLLDCLVAAVAIRVGAAVLHEDRDFDALAQHTELTTVQL
jgi:predicted nucleic acid-binding protein